MPPTKMIGAQIEVPVLLIRVARGGAGLCSGEANQCLARIARYDGIGLERFCRRREKTMRFEIGPYELCPCGSGKKYKFCCAAAAKDKRHGKYPMGTVAYYGPDDRTVTKIAACVIVDPLAEPLVERFVGSEVATDAKVAEQIKQLFARAGVKSVVVSDGIMGCPHEEGADFPPGGDCPFCPFWAGKQGSGRREDDDMPIATTIEATEEEDPDSGAIERNEMDFEGAFARTQEIIGNDVEDMGKALQRLFSHLKAQLVLPCAVTGIEDFQWEERYVIGGWAAREYRKLKKTQPSYTDRFELLELELGKVSRWMMFGGDDIAAHVRRVGDGKLFVLGLAELKAVDEKSPNGQLLDDYSIWFANSR